MWLFTQVQYKEMAQSLIKDSPINLGKFSINRYPNQEMNISLDSAVANEECLVLGTIAPPDENLLSMLLLAHTLKKEGALKVRLILPYLAYARQDKFKPGESMATSLIGSMLKYSGVDEVITVDIHSQEVVKLFPIPVVNLSATEIFSKELASLNLNSTSFVAPDKNAYSFCELVSKLLKKDAACVYMDKKRDKQGIAHLGLHGEIKDDVVILDDMLDTGETLVSCAQIVKEKNAKNINIMVTHGLFTGDKWRKLFDSGVSNIYCTDSIALPKGLDKENIKVFSVVPLIRKYLRIES